VARPAAGRKQHYVDALIVVGLGEARRQCCGTSSDPAQSMCIDRQVELVGPATPLDLDEGDHPPPPRDQINLAAGGLYAAGYNPPAFEPQIPGRQRLTTPTTPFSCQTLGSHFNSSARA